MYTSSTKKNFKMKNKNSCCCHIPSENFLLNCTNFLCFYKDGFIATLPSTITLNQKTQNKTTQNNQVLKQNFLATKIWRSGFANNLWQTAAWTHLRNNTLLQYHATCLFTQLIFYFWKWQNNYLPNCTSFAALTESHSTALGGCIS
jgi:hypothetical protein